MPYRGFKPPPVFVLTYAKTSKKKSRIKQSDWDNYVRNREARGRAQGKVEGIASTARRMLGMGFTSEQISQATGLSPDEVAVLRRGMD